jgi:hypothetical protein
MEVRRRSGRSRCCRRTPACPGSTHVLEHRVAVEVRVVQAAVVLVLAQPRRVPAQAGRGDAGNSAGDRGHDGCAARREDVDPLVLAPASVAWGAEAAPDAGHVPPHDREAEGCPGREREAHTASAEQLGLHAQDVVLARSATYSSDLLQSRRWRRVERREAVRRRDPEESRVRAVACRGRAVPRDAVHARAPSAATAVAWAGSR